MCQRFNCASGVRKSKNQLSSCQSNPGPGNSNILGRAQWDVPEFMKTIFCHKSSAVPGSLATAFCLEGSSGCESFEISGIGRGEKKRA